MLTAGTVRLLFHIVLCGSSAGLSWQAPALLPLTPNHRTKARLNRNTLLSAATSDKLLTAINNLIA
jgi:hypothetical protein